MTLRLLAPIALSLCLAACGGTPPPIEAPVPSGPAEEEIQVGPLTAHVRMLSHDLFEGRAPATRGGDLAAEYLATQLAVLGVEPAGDEGTYFQQVPIIESLVDRSFTMSVPGASYRYSTDVVAFSGVEDARVHVQGEVVFVGHGVVAPEENWNDYAGVDVKGKWVLIMVNDPPATAEEPDLFGGKALTYYGRWTYKYEEAARQGAAGAILIHTDESATYPWQVVQSSWSGAQFSVPPAPGAPALRIKAWMSDAAAIDLVKRAGRDLNALRAAAVQRGFTPVRLGMPVAATLTQRTSRKTSPNVIGRVRGVNEAQAVVFTSHYDHFGMRPAAPGAPAGTDTIYNGAYDNASGVAGLLQIASAMVRATERPARSMYFVFTTAEEAGLLGAEYWAAHPSLPMDQVVANINVDGLNYLGPTRDLTLLGAGRSSLGPMAEALAAERERVIGADQHPERGYFFRSDHFPLAKAGVPALSISEPREFLGPNAEALRERQQAYNTTHYHQPSDEYDPSWDFSGGVNDLRFLAQLAWRIAALPDVPTYNDGDQFAQVRRQP
ncbi:MAG: M28 family peptidase [Vicinamibacterales bacterium]|nr:M28 family peptidase [Vicinamibacterales bacterium]